METLIELLLKKYNKSGQGLPVSEEEIAVPEIKGTDPEEEVTVSEEEETDSEEEVTVSEEGLELGQQNDDEDLLKELLKYSRKLKGTNS